MCKVYKILLDKKSLRTELIRHSDTLKSELIKVTYQIKMGERVDVSIELPSVDYLKNLLFIVYHPVEEILIVETLKHSQFVINGHFCILDYLNALIRSIIEFDKRLFIFRLDNNYNIEMRDVKQVKENLLHIYNQMYYLHEDIVNEKLYFINKDFKLDFIDIRSYYHGGINYAEEVEVSISYRSYKIDIQQSRIKELFKTYLTYLNSILNGNSYLITNENL